MYLEEIAAYGIKVRDWILWGAPWKRHDDVYQWSGVDLSNCDNDDDNIVLLTESGFQVI